MTTPLFTDTAKTSHDQVYAAARVAAHEIREEVLTEYSDPDHEWRCYTLRQHDDGAITLRLYAQHDEDLPALGKFTRWPNGQVTYTGMDGSTAPEHFFIEQEKRPGILTSHFCHRIADKLADEFDLADLNRLMPDLTNVVMNAALDIMDSVFNKALTLKGVRPAAMSNTEVRARQLLHDHFVDPDIRMAAAEIFLGHKHNPGQNRNKCGCGDTLTYSEAAINAPVLKELKRHDAWAYHYYTQIVVRDPTSPGRHQHLDSVDDAMDMVQRHLGVTDHQFLYRVYAPSNDHMARNNGYKLPEHSHLGYRRAAVRSMVRTGFLLDPPERMFKPPYNIHVLSSYGESNNRNGRDPDADERGARREMLLQHTARHVRREVDPDRQASVLVDASHKIFRHTYYNDPFDTHEFVDELEPYRKAA